MTDFTSVTKIRENMLAANAIRQNLRVIYDKCIVVQEILSRYQNDPEFRTQADYLFTPDQLVELGIMINATNTLQTDWLVNHGSVLELS